MPLRLERFYNRFQPVQRLDQTLLDSRLDAEALLDRYAALVYRQTNSYVETGKRLGLDRRTIKDRVERARLAPTTNDDEHGG